MIVRLIVQTFIWFGAMGILLFLAAGTFAWPGAWAYLVPLRHFDRAKPPVRFRPTSDVWARLSKVWLGVASGQAGGYQASDFDHWRDVTPTCCTAPSRQYSQVHILTIPSGRSIFVLRSTMPLQFFCRIKLTKLFPK